MRLGRRKGGQGGGSMLVGGGDNTSYRDGIQNTMEYILSVRSRADSFELGSMLMLLAMDRLLLVTLIRIDLPRVPVICPTS